MANYSPQSGDVIVPGVQGATELLSRVGGFIAGCGEASLAVIVGFAQGTPPSPAQVTGIIQDAITHGAGPGGVSTPAELQATAHDYGVNLQSVPWQTALTQDVGVKPIELGVSNATAFGGADSNVHGHYIAVVGRAANGSYIVSDPNTAASIGGGFVTYTQQQIANAKPFWAGIPSGVGQAFQQGFNYGLTGTLTGGAAPMTDPAQAISQASTSLQDTLTRGAQLAGWLVLALVILGAGLWLLIPDDVKQDAGDAVKGAVETAALA